MYCPEPHRFRFHKHGRPPDPHRLADDNAGCVLLIDEIDKADADLPNGLLETLGNGDFEVPHLGRPVKQSDDCPTPLVVITTNEERELPAAFVRRCLVLKFKLPPDPPTLKNLLVERGRAHFEGRCADEVFGRAADLLLQRRGGGREAQANPPGQAEYLDLLRAVCNLRQTREQQLAWLERLQRFVFSKSPDDIS